MKKQLTDAERVLRSRQKHNHVQVLFKKEHRAQIRLIAERKQKTFVKFLEDEMERLIRQAKRDYGRGFAKQLDLAKTTSMRPAKSREIPLPDAAMPLFPPVKPKNTPK
jgi:phosphoribosylanthranilate isomerase